MDKNTPQDLPNLEQIQQMLLDFQRNPIARRLDKMFHKKSITDIYGIARKEMQHSKFLAWLLDPNESHNMRAFALKRLVSIIAQRGLQQNNEAKGFQQLKQELFVPRLKTNEVAILTEYSIDHNAQAKKHRRLDIFIQNLQIGGEKVNIAIENKVKSQEHSKQTEDYYRSIHQLFPKSQNIFLFLTTKSSKALDKAQEPSCSCKAFIEICYQDILTDILEPLLKEELSTQARTIIEDYIHNITTPSNNATTLDIMAMNNETKELLTQFWDANEELIRTAIQALAWDDEDDNAKELLQTLSKRDYTKYALNGIGAINKTNLAYEVVKNIPEPPHSKEKILQALDAVCKENKIPFLKNEEFDKSYNRRAIPIDVNGQRYYINNQWKKDNIKTFIDIVNHFPNVGITITEAQ